MSTSTSRKRLAVIVMSIAMMFAGFGISASTAYAGGTGSCVSVHDAHLTHTLDGQTVKVTLTGEHPLCVSLIFVVAKYSFDNPSVSIWPQTLVGTSDAIAITVPGTYTATAPLGCGQADAYAREEVAPIPSSTLTAPGQPYEPNFVSDFSHGPATYYQDRPGTCVVTPSPTPTPVPTVTPTPTPTPVPTVTPTPTPVPTVTSPPTPMPTPSTSIPPLPKGSHAGLEGDNGSSNKVPFGILLLAGGGALAVLYFKKFKKQGA
jgi:hypothetical protein